MKTLNDYAQRFKNNSNCKYLCAQQGENLSKILFIDMDEEDNVTLTVFSDKPIFYGKKWNGTFVYISSLLKELIDLNEYKDEEGNVDFSKAIVQINDDKVVKKNLYSLLLDLLKLLKKFFI